MEQYISKSAVVTEFNRLIAELIEEGEDTMFEQGRISAFEDAKLFLDTLEVKEVDNVWHDANETPKGAGDKEILVQFSDFHTSVLEIDDWEYLDHQTKWAYLKDLI